MKQEIKANEIIEKREATIKSIKNNWGLIRSLNISDTRRKPDFDLKKVYEDILRLEKSLITYKLCIQCINMGFSSLEQLSENSPYPIIYELSQLRERKKQLELTPGLKQKGKIKKEELSTEFRNNEINAIDKRIATINVALEKFNKEKTFLIDVA